MSSLPGLCCWDWVYVQINSKYYTVGPIECNCMQVPRRHCYTEPCYSDSRYSESCTDWLKHCCLLITRAHGNAVIEHPTSFWPISLKENQQKGCQKGGKSTFTKYSFQIPGWFGIIKEVLLSCFGMKRGPGWGVVACDVETQCQSLNCISVQTTGVVLLAPTSLTI